ncbi:MAG TPA: TatD family hydrolase [Fimbriimonadales bacterium]|nr:TatD family hydrolase [Fimbriimonadales bacterium]
MIDTHCHLNLVDLFPDPDRAVERALAAGVMKMIAIGIDEKSSLAAVQLAERLEPVYACVGIHPTSSRGFSGADRIEALCAHPKTVAIGEIGLDYHWDTATPEEQVVALEAQWSVAIRLAMPVVFHCRDAYDPLLTWLESQPAFPPSMVFHCFSGNSDQARHALDLGCYLGVDGPVTFKSATGLRGILAGVPADRLLLETDSPYLTPHPYRGKPNEPALLPLVCAGLADCRAVDSATVEAETDANAHLCFPKLR